METFTRPKITGYRQLTEEQAEQLGFAAWWRANWPAATPQSASLEEAERCARHIWNAAQGNAVKLILAGVLVVEDEQTPN